MALCRAFLMLPDFSLLALFRVLSNKPRQLQSLLSICEPETLLKDPEYQRLLTKPICRDAEDDLRWLEKPDRHLITWDDDDYPALLRETYDPPPVLFGWGNRSVLSTQSIRLAIVGSRKASRYGLELADDTARQLSLQVAIVSGLALGIDAAAHEGALKGRGITIAVMGSGCDRVYPRRHWRLAERIADQGLVLSEFPLGTPAYPANFPRRNRVVTGLCQATLVVEAAVRSGSLISARLALNQGREVFAIPGAVTTAGAQGCHLLIKDGATLVENADDIRRELGIATDETHAAIPAAVTLSAVQSRLLKIISLGPQTMDELCDNSAADVESLTVELMSLEVMGLVSSGGGRYKLRRSLLQHSSEKPN